MRQSAKIFLALALLLSFPVFSATFVVNAAWPAPNSLPVPATACTYQWKLDSVNSGGSQGIGPTVTGASRTFLSVPDGEHTFAIDVTCSNASGSTTSTGSATVTVAGQPPSVMTITVDAVQQ